MIHHLQGRHLSKTCLLVFNQREEDLFSFYDNCFLDCPTNRGIATKERLVFHNLSVPSACFLAVPIVGRQLPGLYGGTNT